MRHRALASLRRLGRGRSLLLGAVLVVAGVVALGFGAGLFARPDIRPAPAQARPSEPASPLDVPPPPEPARPALSAAAPHNVALPATAPSTAPPATAAAASPRDEGSLMAKLHEIGETDPPLSLRLAREGNEQFPESEGAPERGWIIAKSLVNMGRRAEARAEAEGLVARYGQNPWAQDLKRHLLIYPE